MPRWFGTQYGQHRRIENEPQQQLQQHPEQEQDQELQQLQQSTSPRQLISEDSSYYGRIKTYLLENYFESYLYSDKPHDYYYNPIHHSGLTHEYLHLTSFIRELVENDQFNYFILIVIVIAGINIGLQSYHQLSENSILSILDDCILIIFSLECLLKMCSEGLAPYVYFTGIDWRWNTFDFTIVFMSLPFWGSLFGGGSLALLRLVRLMRLGKLIKKVPQLQMIVQGLAGGLSSIGYILLLLFLVFYLFAIAGYYVFRENDPFHFGSLPKSLVTCFVCATLDAWSDIMYLNSYGCSKYPMVYQFDDQFNSTSSSNLLRCDKSKPQFVLSTIYFIFLVVITALVMLSLFIGAVTLSMQDSLTELKELAAEKKRQEIIKKQLNKMFQTRADISSKNGASKHLKGRLISRMSSLKNLNMIKSISSEPQEREKEGEGEGSKDKDKDNEIVECSKLSSRKLFGLFSTSYKDMELQNISSDRHSESPVTTQQPDPQSRLEKTPSPVLLNFQSNAALLPHEESSSSFSDSTTSFTKSKKVRNSKLSRIKLSPEELLIQSQVSFSSESEEMIEMRRKLRVGVGDMPAEIEDEPKSWEIFTIRWEMKKNLKDRINLLAEFCKFLVEHQIFLNFVTYVILLAGITVGVTTEPRIMRLPYVEKILEVTDTFILTVFTIECILKLFGEYPKSWKYFNDSWNKFDFLIVIGSYAPGVGSLLTILRLLRLLRVLKLVKSLPQLVVIVNALMMGMESIAYIALILFLCFYVFAIMGMMLFRSNDPFNFGNLHIAMFTLFRCSTLDAWADLMYINVYGCDEYPGDIYSVYPELCTSPKASGFLAVAYFLFFIVIGAQILLTLFIGVVTTSMEEAQAKETRERKIERQLTALKVSLDLSSVQLQMFRDVFNMLDLDGGGLIEEDEVKIGLKAIGDLVEGTNVEAEIKKADPHGRGIDLVTFIVVFCNIPTCRHRRVLRKTVRRWVANKKKRGMFFQQPRRNILRKHTNIWATNAWSFFESVEKKFVSSSSSQPSKDSARGSPYLSSYFTSTNSLNPWRSLNNHHNHTSHNQQTYLSEGNHQSNESQRSLSPFPDHEKGDDGGAGDAEGGGGGGGDGHSTNNSQHEHEHDKDFVNFDEITSPKIEKQPSFIQTNILKQKGSLMRRSSTTTLYQTPHEMETAAYIGHHLNNSNEIEKLNTERRSLSSQERLQSRSRSSELIQSGRRSPENSQNYDRQRSLSPTFVHDFEERSKRFK